MQIHTRARQILSVITVSASKAGVALFSVATAAIVSNMYGQVGLGIFALLRVAPAVFMVLTDPGFSHAIPFLSTNRKLPQSTIIGSSVYVYIAISAFQVALWALCATLIQRHLFTSLPLSAVYVACVLAPIQSLTILVVNLLRSRYRYNLANGVHLFGEIALLAATAATMLWSSESSLAVLVYLLIFSGALSLLVGVGLLAATGGQISKKLDASTIREGLRFGVKSQIGNAFQILNYRVDHLLLGIFLSPEKVAVYFVATKSIEFFRFFTASIVFVFEPILAAQTSGAAKSGVRKMFVPLLLANLLLLSLGVALAPLLYPLLFGDWSTEATPALMVLGIGLAISGANSLFGAYYLGQGRPGVTTVASAAGLMVTAVLALVLIPMFEVIGAAITSSITYSVVTLVYVVVFLRGSAREECR